MQLYRFTGFLTGGALGLAMGLAFDLVIRSVPAASGKISPAFFYMLAVSLGLFGFLFDARFVRRLLSRLVRPSFLTSGIYWTVAFPLAKLTNDLLVAGYKTLLYGSRFVTPYYLDSFGLNGAVGFILLQAMVGGAIGISFFMLYIKVFDLLTLVMNRWAPGLAAQWDYKPDNQKDFGFRN